MDETPFTASAKQPGLPPGTPVFTGEAPSEAVRFSVIDYDAERLETRELASPEDTLPYRDTPTVSWINIEGLHDVRAVQKIGTHFGLHPLVIEDIVHPAQRPKVEVYDGYLYIVMKMLMYHEGGGSFEIEQISLVLGNNFVLTFQERVGDIFDPVRVRLQNNVGRMRRLGPDYLAYALMDAVVDHYFVALERKSDQIEALDEQLMESPGPEALNTISTLKRRMLIIKHAVWPLREVTAALQRDETPLIHESTRIFLRDLYDHTVQVVDMVETMREMVGGMLDLYLSSLSNRMNEVMKVLTIFAAIFIPLTFIAGIYGMNFENIPELHWRYGYFIALGVMSTVAVVMLWYFRKKDWF